MADEPAGGRRGPGSVVYVGVSLTLLLTIVTGMYTAGKLVSTQEQHDQEINTLNARQQEVLQGHRSKDAELDRSIADLYHRLDLLERAYWADQRRHGAYP
jgi:predicted metalloprotease